MGIAGLGIPAQSFIGSEPPGAATILKMNLTASPSQVRNLLRQAGQYGGKPLAVECVEKSETRIASYDDQPPGAILENRSNRVTPETIAGRICRESSPSHPDDPGARQPQIAGA